MFLNYKDVKKLYKYQFFITKKVYYIFFFPLGILVEDAKCEHLQLKSNSGARLFAKSVCQ